MQNDQDVSASEERLRAAMIAGDVQALSELIDENLVFTGPMGNVMTKEEDLEAHRKRHLQIRRLDLFETALHPVYDIVVTTTKARLEATYIEHPVSGIFAYTRIWRSGEHGWRVVAGHCSRIGDL